MRYGQSDSKRSEHVPAMREDLAGTAGMEEATS
jgi:hypothetical protein